MSSDSVSISSQVQLLSPFGSFEWDFSNNLVSFSAQWKAMMGVEENYPLADINSWLEQVHPEDIHVLKRELENFKSTGTPLKINYRLQCGGTPKWMRVHLAATKVENGLPTALIAFQQDINEFMESQSVLEEINCRFKKLVENFSGGILLEDEYRRVFYVNNDFLNFFQLTSAPDKLIGTDSPKIVNQIKHLFSDPENFVYSIDAAVHNGHPVYGEILRMKNGVIIERDYVPFTDVDELKGHLWLYRDITKFRQMDERLKFRIDFEELLLSLFSKFINLDWINIDKEIDEALGIIGSFISADRSYIFLFAENHAMMSNTHEWVNEGISREKEKRQRIPTVNLPLWQDRIAHLKTINVPSVLELPDEASAEKAFLEPLAIKSVVAVPLVYKNEAIGYVGFDSVKDFKTWNDDSIKLLNIAGGVITNALKRKEYEEALSKSEERYKLISYLTADYALAYTIDKNNAVKVDWQSDSLYKTVPFEKGMTYDLNVLTLSVHPEDIEYVLKQRKKLKHEKSISSEYRIVTNSGEIRWMNEFGLSDKPANSDELKIYLAAQDITDRKLHEERLLSERTLLRTIIDNIPDPIYVKDLEGRKIIANNAEVQILGAACMEDVIGKMDQDFYPEDVSAKTRFEDERVMQTQTPLLNEEGFVMTKSGETKWFIGNKIPVRDSAGNVTGLVGISYNITARKRSEEALRISESKYKYVVNNIKEVIFQTDVEGLWLFLNPAWTEITGFSVEESVGTNFLNYVLPEDQQLNYERFAPLIRREKEYCRHEIRYITKSGGFKWIEVFARLTFDEWGNVTGTAGTLNDITMRRQSEEEMKHALAKEKELNELKSKFVSMVSHEFRTPLAAILSSSDLLELYWAKWTPEKRNSLLVKIKRSVGNLIDILNDVTEVNRPDVTNLRINMEDIDPALYTEEIIEELRGSQQSTPNIIFNPLNIHMAFKTDKKLFRQIVANLVTNAMKYTPMEKNVYISVGLENNQIILTVKDEGIGIPEEDFQILFEPFMRSKNTGKIKGTGLGLSILKRALDILGGKIEVESHLDEGSVFKVSIPVTKQ